MSLPHIIFDGEPRILGALPPRETCAVPRLDESFPLLDPKDWIETDMSNYGGPIKNQFRTNSCVGHGSASMAEIAWEQKGYPPILFSACFIYAQINNNVDQGAIVSDAAEEMQNIGIALESEVPEGMIYKSQIPQSAYVSAAKYKLARVHHCPDWASINTALSLNMPVVGGLLLGPNFANVDQDGVVPMPTGIEGGHCMGFVGRKKIRGRPTLKTKNSWSTKFGINGYCFIDEDFVETTRQYQRGRLDFFALEAMGDVSTDEGPTAIA